MKWRKNKWRKIRPWKLKTERDGQRDDDHCDIYQGIKCQGDWLPAIQGLLEDNQFVISL